MCTTEMVLFAPFLKTSKFIPACISIYILSLVVYLSQPGVRCRVNGLLKVYSSPGENKETNPRV